jgi:hypothetical protein
MAPPRRRAVRARRLRAARRPTRHQPAEPARSRRRRRGVTRLPLSSRSLRDSGIAFVPLTADEAYVVLAWRPEAAAPALTPFAAVVSEVARELDPLTAG